MGNVQQQTNVILQNRGRPQSNINKKEKSVFVPKLFWEKKNEKNRELSSEPRKYSQQVSVCHLKVIPIQFPEPKIGPKNSKFTKITKKQLPTPKILSNTRGLLGDY